MNLENIGPREFLAIRYDASIRAMMSFDAGLITFHQNNYCQTHSPHPPEKKVKGWAMYETTLSLQSMLDQTDDQNLGSGNKQYPKTTLLSLAFYNTQGGHKQKHGG